MNTIAKPVFSQNLAHYDLFKALEKLESQNNQAAQFGEGNRHTEPAKISSVYALDTVPADIHDIIYDKKGITVYTNIYGLGTTDGPFDANLIERIMHSYNAAPLRDFLDIFHHRIVSLFYKSHKLLKSNTSPAFKALIASLSSKSNIDKNISDTVDPNISEKKPENLSTVSQTLNAQITTTIYNNNVTFAPMPKHNAAQSDMSNNAASALYQNKNHAIDQQIKAYASTINLDTSQLNFAWPAFYTHKSVQKYLRCVLQNNHITVKPFAGSWMNTPQLQCRIGTDKLDKKTPKILGTKTMQGSMGLHCTIPCNSFDQYLALLPGKSVSIEILRKIQHHLFLSMPIMMELTYESDSNRSFGYLGQTTTIGKQVLMHSLCLYNTDHEIFYS